jgi:hypothetical protein
MPESFAAGLHLAPDDLTRPFAPEQFNFTTTDDLEFFRGVLGQERAVEALQFGVAMPRPGYNVAFLSLSATSRPRASAWPLRSTGSTSTTSTNRASRVPWNCRRARRAPSSATSVS